MQKASARRIAQALRRCTSLLAFIELEFEAWHPRSGEPAFFRILQDAAVHAGALTRLGKPPSVRAVKQAWHAVAAILDARREREAAHAAWKTAVTVAPSRLPPHGQRQAPAPWAGTATVSPDASPTPPDPGRDQDSDLVHRLMRKAEGLPD